MRESKLHLARSVEHLEEKSIKDSKDVVDAGEKEEDKSVRSGASLQAIRSRKQLIKKEQLDELLMKIDNLEEEVHLLQSLMEKEESEDLTSDLAPSSPSRPLSAPTRSDHSLDFTATPDSGFTSQSTFELLSQNFTKKLEEQARHQDSLKQGLAQQSSDIKNLGKKLNHLGGEINKQLAHLRQKVENVEKELKDLFSYVDESLQARGGSSDSGNLDSEAITRAQKAILDLQAEVEKLNGTTNFLMDENTNRQKQIENIYLVTNRLEETKADKEYVDTEVDVKADKKSVEGKVNRSLFDSTCAELNKMINDLLEKLAAYEEAWKKAHGTLSDDVEGKLDRMELDALKDYIDAKLKALNKKMNATQAHDMVSQFGISDDDAAGIRKQLVTRFHCISCDRPVDMNPAQPIPSLPAPGALPPTRSPRPYTTFELEQIRQHAKSLGNGKVYYNNSMMGPDGVDYYATTRSCGGNHTTTFPHRRMTRITNTKDIYREEEIPAAYLALSREERDIKGSDGHVYRGRLDPRSQIEARLPTHLQAQETAPAAPAAPSRKMQTSPPGRNPRTVRPPPSSAASSRRPQSSGSGGGERPTTARPSSRPTSAHPGSSRPQSAHTPQPHPTPQPPEEAPHQPSPPPPQIPTEAFAEPPAEQPAEAQQPQSTEQNVPVPEQPAEEAEEIPKE
ncbi:glutamine-rich protein 2 isoform X3 [Lingula anatina]|uniref:Glutamine-rich protein 2 isoform X3 n=1 Tax=Lingula anatina TaxID=7574 RepID=A0A1S3JWY7_LINAN|nr:glutamine-rich protein 2 isoform X3 [Lingula anatina]|eukprot:XP_013414945.1 glutamine-rich protein 2 isoform X3 [Lingula anatina]